MIITAGDEVIIKETINTRGLGIAGYLGVVKSVCYDFGRVNVLVFNSEGHELGSYIVNEDEVKIRKKKKKD